MDILLLGGQTPRHLEWSHQIADGLSAFGHRVVPLEYANWLDQTAVTDVESEVTAATKLADGLTSPIIVAKSIGTVIATLAIGRGGIRPSGEVFMGMPLAMWQQSPEATGYLPGLPPLTAVQNEHDPVGEASDALGLVTGHTPGTWWFETIPGVATHDYVDAPAIARWADHCGHNPA